VESSVIFAIPWRKRKEGGNSAGEKGVFEGLTSENLRSMRGKKGGPGHAFGKKVKKRDAIELFKRKLKGEAAKFKDRDLKLKSHKEENKRRRGEEDCKTTPLVS